MGVVCCEAPAKLAHEDNVETSNRQHDVLSVSTADASAPTVAAARLASARRLASNHGSQATPKPAPSTNNDASASLLQDTTTKTQDKKSVRISDEVTLIPLLTSSSFFRKTKPTTIQSQSSYSGIMPSFRIVSPAQDQEPSSTINLVPKSSLWWTKEERREILQANQKASRDFKRFQPTKMRQANLVYNDIVMDCQCHSNDGQQHNVENYEDEDIYDFFQNQRLNAAATRSSTGATGITSTTSGNASSSSTKSHPSTKKRKRYSDFTPTHDSSDLPPLALPEATIVLPATVRGLEWGVMPDAKRYRKAHARTVLKWQERFRKMNERRKRTRYERKPEAWNLTESSSSSSSSASSSEDETDIERNNHDCERTTRDQQDLMLGQKASISSLRSCILARVFGKSDAIAANQVENEKPQRSQSPTPSLTGTESSSGSDNDESEAESDVESDDDESDCSDMESDSEDEDEENSFPGVYYTTYSSKVVQPLGATSSSHQRMFRPRMMPPRSWR